MEASMHFAHNEAPQASAPALKFKGEPIELGDVTYIVPPLSIGALKSGLFDRIRRSSKDDFDLALAVDVVHAALQRNYPHLTMTVLDELPPSAMRQLVAAFNAVVRQSGFREAAAAELGSAEGNGAPGQS